MWTTWMTIFGISFIFIMTTLGSAMVYILKGEINAKSNALFLGLASGVMIAASVWSLLLPAIDQLEGQFGHFAFLPVAIGILLGGVALVLLDKLVSVQLLKGGKFSDTFQKQENRGFLRMFLAVTLHNIPEGLAVGFAFGAASAVGTTAAYLSALGLAFGIGIQNFPEGAALTLPMKSVIGKHKSFLCGSISGVVEPLFGIIGYFLASSLIHLQPWLLAFAAGAMIFVSADDLIPATKLEEGSRLGAWGVVIGFVIMMTLDVALG